MTKKQPIRRPGRPKLATPREKMKRKGLAGKQKQTLTGNWVNKNMTRVLLLI